MSREVTFAIGGALIIAGLIPIAIAILASVPVLNMGLLGNFGGIGIVLCFLGFYLIGTTIFDSQ